MIERSYETEDLIVPIKEGGEKEPNLLLEGKESAIALLSIIGNTDLNHSFGIAMQKYFDALIESNAADKFRVPDLTQELWNVYGDFRDLNSDRATSAEYIELDKIVRTEFMPKLVETLNDYSVKIATEKSQ